MHRNLENYLRRGHAPPLHGVKSFIRPTVFLKLVKRGVFFNSKLFHVVHIIILRSLYELQTELRCMSPTMAAKFLSIKSIMNCLMTCLRYLSRSNGGHTKPYSFVKTSRMYAITLLLRQDWFSFNLQKLCRVVILQRLYDNGNLPSSIDKLPLPKSLVRFLSCDFD